jgi:uncharacterized protein
MPSSDAIAVFTTLTFLLAGLVKGVVGMGLPTVAVGLLAEVMAPAQAAALLLVPSLVTNVWQLVAGPSCCALVRRLWPLMVRIAAGSWLGSGWLTQDQGSRATMALGAALVAYAVLGLSKVKVAVPLAWEPWLSAPVGAVTGIITAATGVFVIPAVPFLGALGLEKDDLVQALGLSFTTSTLALGGSLFFDGALQASLGASLLALLPASIGMLVGQRLRDRVNPATFHRYFFLGLLGLGVDQVARRLV